MPGCFIWFRIEIKKKKIEIYRAKCTKSLTPFFGFS